MPKPVVRPTLAERLFHAAVTYLGAPYEATGPNDKMDCSELVVRSFRGIGFQVPDMTAQELHDTLFTRDQRSSVRSAVGALFRREGGDIVHIGLLGPNFDTVIHATLADGRVVVKAVSAVQYSEIKFLDSDVLLEYLGPALRAPRTEVNEHAH
jgi:hypothetical protein